MAVIASHYSIDFSEHYLAEHLAPHGIGFLGWNTRFRGDDAHFLLDQAVADIGVGVRWLREQAGVDAVILLGNSGGASLMSAYQSQAVAPCLHPAPGLAPARGSEEVGPGDGYISLAAHPGRPDVLTAWMDGAVVDEGDPVATDPDLDLWNPTNGPPYSADFVARYRRAQKDRNQRITDWANAELERLGRAKVSDRLFTTARTWADPRMVDPSIEPTRRPPNSCYAGLPERANRGVWGIAGASTLRTWLSMWSLQTSQCRAAPHLAKVTVPSLVLDADADTGVFPSDTDAIFDALAADDKTRATLPGDHYYRTPETARGAVAGHVAGWVRSRFGT